LLSKTAVVSIIYSASYFTSYIPEIEMKHFLMVNYK